MFELEQEEYCFSFDLYKNSANLLINSMEQIFTEKLKSLLKLGFRSTRYKDLFDFYYLYNKFDFNKFQPKWLLNLLPHTLKIISRDKMVRTKIRKSIADMISTTNLMLQDKERLQNILIHYFCQ